MDFICFSHLRWNFVYQRPQHLLSRFAKKYPTYYIEEAVHSGDEDGYTLENTKEGVKVVVPHLKEGNDTTPNRIGRLRTIINHVFDEFGIDRYVLWYYTPMAISFTDHLTPDLMVYDCMDELSAFKFAPPELKANETILLSLADLVFTGGNSLYKAKKLLHPNVWPMPSSIDKDHFQEARHMVKEPVDQEAIAHPRLGFFGVIDERFDIALIEEVSKAKLEWNFIFIGPVVKIDPALLPQSKNVHYLGAKAYEELPRYLSGWDIALIPFAINESTQYISPTKTPEYLAAGIPVVSTPIQDVIEPYGEMGLVDIAFDVDDFIGKATLRLAKPEPTSWLQQVDDYLLTISWDITWERMDDLMTKELKTKSISVTQNV